MVSVRMSPVERLALAKLANRHRQSMSDVLRELIAQAAAAQRTNKSAASVATQTTNTAA
jgi:hypothetical protein